MRSGRSGWSRRRAARAARRRPTLDPATGSLLGERDARAGFIGTTRDLHDTLLLRDWGGREAVGWLGVLMLLFCATGIWIWWPRDGALGRALVTLRRRPALLLNLDLHRILGIWMAVVLAVVACSGVAIIFPGWFRPLLGIAAPPPAAFGPPQRDAARPRRAPCGAAPDAPASTQMPPSPRRWRTCPARW